MLNVLPAFLLLLFTSSQISSAADETVELHQALAQQQSCRISDLRLRKLESIVHCFPEDFRRNDEIKEDTECLYSEDKHGKNRLALKKCLHGQWTDVSLGEKKHPKRRLFGFIAAIVACFVLCPGGGGRGGSTVIKYPPTFNDPCRPPHILNVYYTAARRTTISISWTVPPASDRDGTVQSVVQTSGLPSGSNFIGSVTGRQHVITYKATDNDGLTAYCSFTFTVYVRVCNQTATWPMNGYRSCDLNTQVGSICTYNCHDGYVLTGNRTITCQGNSAPVWTEAPTCERITCSEPPTFENAAISCSSNTYGSVCPIRCDPGYKLTGMTYIQCLVDGSWTPIIDTTCTDNLPPEISCITPQTFYADRGQTSTTVEWILPTVTDALDPNVTVYQIGGQVYGSVFSLGSSVVTYRATDNEGNESGMCTIVIIVDETTCQHPYDVLQDLNIIFSCNSYSYSYGTECELACRFHYSLIGDHNITCERDDRSNPGTIGSWSWGTGEQPYCNQTECPIFEPPMNGALARSYVGQNAIYTMSCQVNYTIPEVYIGFNGQWICQNSGTFIPTIPVPDCVIPRTPRTVDLHAEIFYYDGDCTDPATQAQILQSVRQILEQSVNPVIRTLCPLANNCTTGNVEITCGEGSGRKKRSEIDRNGAILKSRPKRQGTPTLIVNFYIYTSIVKAENQTVLEALDETDMLQSNVLVPYFEGLVANGTFDLAGFSLRNDSYQSPQYGDINCRAQGHKLRQLICEPCPPTYFLNTSDVCEFCPLGTYSDVEGLTSCKPCPTGYTTLQIGARNESQCKELCPVGSYSNDGVVPCIACPVGYYQNSSGQSSCFQCESGTTELSGSNSSSHCQAFHILVNDTDGKVTAGNFDTDLYDLAIMFWARRFADLPTMFTLMLTSDASSRLLIEMSDTIRVALPGTFFDKTVVYLGPSLWTHLAITWDTTNGNVRIYVQGELIINEYSITPSSSPVIGNGTIELESSGSTGVFMADLHVANAACFSGNSSVLTQCWTEIYNDVFNMNSFRYRTLRGVNIQTPTFCDPIDDCASYPCNNQLINHTCVDGMNSYTCYCVDGFSGDNCEVPPDFCVNASCLNGASCVNGVNGYTCACPNGFSGDLCDVEPVSGGWSPWSGWTECSVTCANGNQTRTRSCDNPEPSPYGANCTGVSTEIQSCNMGNCQDMECTSLERGLAMVLHCNTDPSSRTQTCRAECLPGFVRPVGLDLNTNFTCGSLTGFTWEPMPNPPDCVDPTAPDSIDIKAQINTSTPINTSDEVSYKEEVVNNLSEVPCISSGLCSVSIDVVTSNTESNGSTVSLDLIINLSEDGPLGLQNYLQTSNASSALQEVIDSVNSLEESASYINSSSNHIFNVTVGETTYTAVSNTLFEGTVTCPRGQAATEGVCAPCPAGTYYRDSRCVNCEKGSYSVSNGQTACIMCPEGFTTITIGSYKASQCIEPNDPSTATTPNTHTTGKSIETEPSSTEDTVIQGEPATNSSVNKYLIVGIVIASVLCVVFLIGFIIILRKRQSKPRNNFSNDDERNNFAGEFINHMKIENDWNVSKENHQNKVTNLENPNISDDCLISPDPLEASVATGTYVNDPNQSNSNQHRPTENIYLPMNCYNPEVNIEAEDQEDESTVYAQIKDSNMDDILRSSGDDGDEDFYIQPK